MSSGDPDPAELDAFEIARELRLVVGQLVRRVRAETDTLSPRLASALGSLSRDGAMTTSALAARQNVRHQSMAATVKQLESSGYVERAPNPSDRRSALIAISAAGEARLEAERSRRYGWLAEAITARLSPAEQNQMAGVLPLLARLVDEHPDQPAARGPGGPGAPTGPGAPGAPS